LPPVATTGLHKGSILRADSGYGVSLPPDYPEGRTSLGILTRMDVFNLFDGATETPADPSDPPGYACSAVRVGPKIGASKIGMSI
jgi:hypothetical protein